MRRALIGHTGFVGGNLKAQWRFDEFYNSTNITGMTGREYDLVVCAGVPAVKWKANRDPENDWRVIESLLTPLQSVRAAEFILVSTVDVFDPAVEVDEDTPVETEGLHPYGLHRRRVEVFARRHFEKTRILRLPGLFGKGLRKNIVFDFLMENNINQIDHRSVFQFYNLDHLGSDLSRMREADLDLLHLATEPVSVEQVARNAFDREFHNPVSAAPARYDFRSRHAGLWGHAAPYQYAQSQVLAELKDFATRARPEGLLGGGQ